MLNHTSSSAAHRSPLKPGRIIPLLVAGALCAIAFTCAGGVIVYNNTQHMIETHDWLDHSHNVLIDLQMELQQLDRIGYSVQLYDATGNIEELRAAQSAAIAMHAGILSLQSLLRDNPSQTRHVQELDARIDELFRTLDTIKVARAVPEHQIQEDRRAINAMQEEERDILRQRSDESEKGKDRSLLSGAGFLGFSLVVVVVLFILLLRDVFRRGSFEKRISMANDRLEASIEELERCGGEAILLKEARDELQLCVTSQEAQTCSVRHFQEIVPGSSGAIVLIDNSRSMLEAAVTWNNPSSLADALDVDACCGLRAGRPRWRRPGQSELHCSHFTGAPPENYVCIPLAAQGDTMGFVYLSCPTNEIADLASSRTPLIQEMVELASMAFAGLNLRAKLESQSIRDSLTNLFNRHFMEIALDRELHRVLRRQTSLAVIMLDIDHFKTFNDAFGHEAGDIVLRTVAQSLEQSVRSEDIVCRYGGEEFVIILPEIDEALALERAEEIRLAVGRLRLKCKEDTLRPITISVGLAMYPNPARDAPDLLRMSDRAMYNAKHAGRNCVIVAGNDALIGDENLLPTIHIEANTLF